MAHTKGHKDVAHIIWTHISAEKAITAQLNMAQFIWLLGTGLSNIDTYDLAQDAVS